jgi:hypothetical protein
MFDILSRLGNRDGTEKSRFTNPGTAPQTSAAAAGE